MTRPRLAAPTSGRLVAAIAAGLGALIVVLVALLLIRPPIVEDERLAIPRNGDGGIDAVFLGGTLTDGVFASREELGFRPLVVAALGEGLNESRGGVESSPLLEAADAVDVSPDADLVIIELGSGDVWAVPDDQFEAEYERVVARVRDAAPDAALLCLGVWNDSQAAALYDDAVRGPCLRAGGRFIGLSDLFEQPAMRGVAGEPAYPGPADGFHPSDAGYQAIAERILAELRLD